MFDNRSAEPNKMTCRGMSCLEIQSYVYGRSSERALFYDSRTDEQNGGREGVGLIFYYNYSLKETRKQP